MRLPVGLATIALLGLLGGSVGASTVLALQASNSAAGPSTGAYATANTSSDPDRFGMAFDACVSGTAGHLPDGVDENTLCNCAADKMTTRNIPQRDAIAQCTAEARVTASDARASEIRECVGGAAGHLPAGTDAVAFCSCAVDKMMTNSTPQRDAIDQCATAMHLTLPGSEDEDPGTNAMAGNLTG
jgi:hypothetical protein